MKSIYPLFSLVLVITFLISGTVGFTIWEFADTAKDEARMPIIIFLVSTFLLIVTKISQLANSKNRD